MYIENVSGKVWPLLSVREMWHDTLALTDSELCCRVNLLHWIPDLLRLANSENVHYVGLCATLTLSDHINFLSFGTPSGSQL
jgi:hypothetical protein